MDPESTVEARKRKSRQIVVDKPRALTPQNNLSYG